VSGRSKAYSLFLSMPVSWIRYGQGSQLMKLSNNHNPSTLDNASHELPSASSPNLNRAIYTSENDGDYFAPGTYLCM